MSSDDQSPTLPPPSSVPDKDDPLEADEFQKFIYTTPTTVAKDDIHWNPINWWIDESRKGNYDTPHLYTLDHLSCPAMATQCERVFSAVKRTLTPERNALGLNILEACECLRWWRHGSGNPTRRSNGPGLCHRLQIWLASLLAWPASPISPLLISYMICDRSFCFSSSSLCRET